MIYLWMSIVVREISYAGQLDRDEFEKYNQQWYQSQVAYTKIDY